MVKILELAAEAARIFLQRKEAGRALTVLPDDVFLVSYPRSGNTWTRFLIAHLMNSHEPATFANIESRIPEIYLFPDRVLLGVPRPRVLKSHECFDPRYKRIIHIVRDPRDVAVSHYHYSIKRRTLAENCRIEQYLPRFLAGNVTQTMESYGCWGDHVRSWLALRGGHNDFLALRYEDMLENAERALRKVATFLGMDSNPERLSRAVELSSSVRMRKLEKEQSKGWKLTKGTREDCPFIRSATSGAWKSALPRECVLAIESAWGPLMQSLGYELATTGPAHLRKHSTGSRVEIAKPACEL